MRRADDPLTLTVARVVDEVHGCTHALGQLSAEVGQLAREQVRFRLELEDVKASSVRTLEQMTRTLERLGAMREALDSVPEDAEDTARVEVDKLRRELLDEKAKMLERQIADAATEKNAREDREESERKSARDRRTLWLVAVIGPPAAAAIGALATHLIHVFGK